MIRSQNIRRLSIAIAALVGAQAQAESAAQTVSFIACPVYRDTDAGRKSGCWLADERATGVRYDVSLSPTKPDWNHAVLVEGRLSAEQEDACGGQVLDPVRVSVLPDPCVRQMIPAEGFAGRAYTLVTRNVRPVSEERETPPPPYAERAFDIMFDFNKDFIVYQLSDYYFDQVVTWIRAVHPSKIIVTGYAATSPHTVSGQKLSETRAIARARAEKITEALVRVGVAPDRIKTAWKTKSEVSSAEGADGLPEASRRRVEIRVIP